MPPPPAGRLPPPPRAWSFDDARVVAAAYADGVPVRDIAVAVRRTRAAVRTLVRDLRRARMLPPGERPVRPDTPDPVRLVWGVLAARYDRLMRDRVPALLERFGVDDRDAYSAVFEAVAVALLPEVYAAGVAPPAPGLVPRRGVERVGAGQLAAFARAVAGDPPAPA